MDSKRCDVIVTYCWNRVGYNIMRSLTAKGLCVYVADTSKNNICSRSSFCSGAFTYPDPFTQEEVFVQTLKKKLNELDSRVLLPTHDESIVIMRHRDEFPEDLIIPYMGCEMLENLSNKAWVTKKASECGVPVPKVYASWEEVDLFPCVVKTVFGNSAKTVFFPKSVNELEKIVYSFSNEDILIEELIGGTDYSVDCVRWDGFFKASTYKALMTKTKGGGTTTQREIVSMPEMERYAEVLLSYVGFKGVCGLDFRYDSSTGRIAFIEINARFTGGLATPIAAGFDIPWVLYKLATTGSYDEKIDVKIGTRTKWILGDFITLTGRLLSFDFNKKELRQVFSFNGFDAFDDYRSDDRRAILGEMSYYLRKLIKKAKLNP